MKPHRIVLSLIVIAIAISAAVYVRPVAADDSKAPASAATEPRAKNGKRLLTAFDLFKVANVRAPRIAPDGRRLAYSVSETKTEKDKEWKAVTQVWVVPTAGG